MFVDDVKQFDGCFETLVYASVDDDMISICDSICLNDIPHGNLSKQYFIDKNYKEVNILDYITSLNYYCYYKPISYDLFKHYFDLNNEVIECLENNNVNVYELELIMGGLLAENGGYRSIKSSECYLMERVNSHKVKIPSPPHLFKDNVIITINSYYPNCLYIMD